MTEQRAQTQCDQCGQVDDHPKAHWDTGESYHHDCLPFRRKQELLDSSEHAGSIVAAAESGVHGHELLAHIRDLHEES